MKFPITRESLQAFDQKKEDAEKTEHRIQQLLEWHVKEICDTLVKGMAGYSRDKKFVWRGFTNSAVFDRREGAYLIQIDDYIPRIIEKLKETFIGCDVISDPLKTYIIIDWS